MTCPQLPSRADEASLTRAAAPHCTRETALERLRHLIRMPELPWLSLRYCLRCRRHQRLSESLHFVTVTVCDRVAGRRVLGLNPPRPLNAGTSSGESRMTGQVYLARMGKTQDRNHSPFVRLSLNRSLLLGVVALAVGSRFGKQVLLAPSEYL